MRLVKEGEKVKVGRKGWTRRKRCDDFYLIFSLTSTIFLYLETVRDMNELLIEK